MMPRDVAGGEPCRLLIVGPVPPPLHGVTVMTEALLGSGIGTGWDIVHIDTSDHRTIDNIGTFDFGNIVLAVRHVIRYTRQMLLTRPDVVYLPLSQSIAGFTRDAAFLVAARLSSAQIVVHAHGARYQEFYRRMPAAVRGLMRFAMGGVTGIIVLGEGQRGQFEGLAPRRARIEVVPNGVRDEWPDGPAVRGPKEGGTVLFLGNLRPQKGFLDVLDAVPVVLRALPATRFVFAGRPVGGAATAALVSRRLREPGIQDAVVFAGAVTAAERRQLLETADVLAFPPRWNEGQGLVALEAMSASVPLVVTSSGGLAETVRDGVEAIVVPRRDPQAVACALTRLLQDHQLRARMGAAARERFESKYTLERWLSRMRDAFGRMLDKAESA